jgi:phosphatidylglycerophosphate synthase
MSMPDRRPIAARKRPIFQKLASSLARAGISANTISIAGMICGIGAGGAFLATQSVTAIPARVLFAAGAALVQLRLLANMLDGMVAIETSTSSALGELYNEIPDRISDSTILIGVGYAAGSMPLLGWFAALLAMLTAYIRAVGKSVGAGSDFSGPMAKPQRMFFVTLLGAFCALAPSNWMPFRPAVWILGLIVAGSALTAIRRITRIAATLREAGRDP